MSLRVSLIIAALAALLSACGQSAPAIQVSDVWARPAAAMAMPAMNATPDATAMVDMKPTAATMDMSSMGATSAVYLTIRNSGGAPDRLVAAQTDVAAATQMHTTTTDSAGVMSMQPVDGVPVAAGATVAFQPGGLHVMLIGLKRDLNPGDTFPVTFTFEQAGKIAVQATVRAP